MMENSEECQSSFSRTVDGSEVNWNQVHELVWTIQNMEVYNKQLIDKYVHEITVIIFYLTNKMRFPPYNSIQESNELNVNTDEAGINLENPETSNSLNSQPLLINKENILPVLEIMTENFENSQPLNTNNYVTTEEEVAEVNAAIHHEKYGENYFDPPYYITPPERREITSGSQKERNQDLVPFQEQGREICSQNDSSEKIKQSEETDSFDSPHNPLQQNSEIPSGSQKEGNQYIVPSQEQGHEICSQNESSEEIKESEETDSFDIDDYSNSSKSTIPKDQDSDKTIASPVTEKKRKSTVHQDFSNKLRKSKRTDVSIHGKESLSEKCIPLQEPIPKAEDSDKTIVNPVINRKRKSTVHQNDANDLRRSRRIYASIHDKESLSEKRIRLQVLKRKRYLKSKNMATNSLEEISRKSKRIKARETK